MTRRILPPLVNAQRRAWIVSVVCVTLLPGCGRSAKTTTVTGNITFKGQPVSSGLINFQPAGGKTLGGPIKADGAYEFQLPPGEYKVRIDAPPAIPASYKEGDPLPKLGPRLVPEKYADFNGSGLTASIKDQSEPQSLDFPLP